MVFASIRASMPSTAIFLRARAEKKNCFASLRAKQASTRLNFASKSSKGKILRAVKNFNGPFITPKFVNIHFFFSKRNSSISKVTQLGRCWYFELGLPVWKPSMKSFLAPRLYIAIIKQSQDSMNKMLILVRWLKIWVRQFHFFILLSKIFHKYNAMNIYKQ